MKRISVLIISICALLLFRMIAMIPFVQAASTLEIAHWYVNGRCRTYEEMIMDISIHNNDVIDHTFDLDLMTTYEGIFKGWSGSIVSIGGTIKAGDYLSVPIVLYPTEVPHGGQVQFSLTLISENPSPPPYFAVVDSETKWVTIQKGDLETSVDSLQQYYASLNSSIFSLNSTSIGLNSSYTDIANRYDSLEAKYNSLSNDLTNTRNLVYVTLAIAVVFAGTTLYLAFAKRSKRV